MATITGHNRARCDFDSQWRVWWRIDARIGIHERARHSIPAFGQVREGLSRGSPNSGTVQLNGQC